MLWRQTEGTLCLPPPHWEGRRAYTHIYTVHTGMATNVHTQTHTHTLTDSSYAHTHTLYCYTDTSVQWNTGFTSDNTDILEHINDCTPVYGNLFSSVHPYVKAMWSHFIVCISSMCVKVYVYESVCARVSSDSPGGTPGAGCRGNAASAGVAEL